MIVHHLSILIEDARGGRSRTSYWIAENDPYLADAAGSVIAYSQQILRQLDPCIGGKIVSAKLSSVIPIPPECKISPTTGFVEQGAFIVWPTTNPKFAFRQFVPTWLEVFTSPLWQVSPSDPASDFLETVANPLEAPEEWSNVACVTLRGEDITMPERIEKDYRDIEA